MGEIYSSDNLQVYSFGTGKRMESEDIMQWIECMTKSCEVGDIEYCACGDTIVFAIKDNDGIKFKICRKYTTATIYNEDSNWKESLQKVIEDNNL